jgi:hypothetical protein
MVMTLVVAGIVIPLIFSKRPRALLDSATAPQVVIPSEAGPAISQEPRTTFLASAENPADGQVSVTGSKIGVAKDDIVPSPETRPEAIAPSQETPPQASAAVTPGQETSPQTSTAVTASQEMPPQASTTVALGSGYAAPPSTSVPPRQEAAPQASAAVAPRQETPPQVFAAIAPIQQTPAQSSVAMQGPSRVIDREELANLLKRGRYLLSVGDISSARLLLERAADAQEASAAFDLAGTYDPAVLGRSRALGVVPDVAMARLWYEKALKLGYSEAEGRLAQLQR